MKIIAQVNAVGQVQIRKGQQYEVPDAIGLDLIKCGHAIAVDGKRTGNLGSETAAIDTKKGEKRKA